jgi:hypothetical protein
MSSAGATVTDTQEHPGGLARLGWMASVVFFAVLPVLALYTLFVGTVSDDVVATDFEQFYRAAEAILNGKSPYLDPQGATWGGPYPYPPLPAFAAIPLTALSLKAAGLVTMVVLVLVALAVPFVLGVRDWRCYSLVLVWPPVISAIQTANLTLWFALVCALAWRFRDRLFPVSASVGITLAMKFFLWPLVVWLAATRRLGAAALTCAIGAALLVLSWAAIGFAGFLDYPDLLRRLEDVVGADSYTVYIVGLDAGLPSGLARGLWLVVGLSMVVAVVAIGRRGDERSSFILAIAASLALTPIVWLHYFALLLVVVALAQPRLALLWFVPLGMVLTPGSGQPTPFQTAWTLAIAALVFALALHRTLRGVSRRPSSLTVPETA